MHLSDEKPGAKAPGFFSGSATHFCYGSATMPLRLDNCPATAALLATLLVGCSAEPDPGDPPAAPPDPPESAELIGRIANPAVREASGLAASRYRDDQFFVLNDSGAPAEVHAIAVDGADLGTVKISNIENIDWEDLASFKLNGARYLLIADIGDNGAQRDFVALHIVAEPRLPNQSETTAGRSIRFRYPDGPRDAEGIAVDASEGAVYVLTKRTLPAELYRVPLTFSDAAEPLVAEYLGPVTSLPEPSRTDRALAHARQNWHWQPTGMDIAADGRSIAILTYRAVYRFDRAENQDWVTALDNTPTEQSLGLYFGAEAIAFDDEALVVTFEAQHPPLLRFLPLPQR